MRSPEGAAPGAELLGGEVGPADRCSAAAVVDGLVMAGDGLPDATPSGDSVLTGDFI
jgi:hypothetical protein